MLQCSHFLLENIEVRFLLDDETGDPRWEERGKIIQIYKQCAIVLTIPELPHWIKDLGKVRNILQLMYNFMNSDFPRRDKSTF